jgi:hypothetical protein
MLINPLITTYLRLRLLVINPVIDTYLETPNRYTNLFLSCTFARYSIKELDMQINGLQKRTLLLLLVFLLAPSASRSQKNSLPAPASTGESSIYPNTSAGLRQLLEAMLAAAKSNNSPALTVLLKSTEIPNCDAWLHTMYDSDKADSWMSLCEQKAWGSMKSPL